MRHTSDKHLTAEQIEKLYKAHGHLMSARNYCDEVFKQSVNDKYPLWGEYVDETDCGSALIDIIGQLGSIIRRQED